MYYLYGIERLIQLSTESAFGIFSIIGGLILLGTSVTRAIVTRKIATRRRTHGESLDRSKGDTNHGDK
jgi:multidrug efflux pump subunit AcrB